MEKELFDSLEQLISRYGSGIQKGHIAILRRERHALEIKLSRLEAEVALLNERHRINEATIKQLSLENRDLKNML